MHSLAKFYLKRRLGLDNHIFGSRNMKTSGKFQFSQISRLNVDFAYKTQFPLGRKM